jgi:hypothetical protein
VMDSIVRVRADIAAHERARGEPVPRI